MRVVEWNRALDSAARIENANLARAKTRAARSAVDCLLLIQEHGLNTETLVHLPAVSIWSDFDDRHDNSVLRFSPIELIRSFDHERG
jgi:hypothetical protein